MNSRVVIEQRLAQYSENELIFASRFYREHCADSMSEAADRKSTRLNSSHKSLSRMPSSA